MMSFSKSKSSAEGGGGGRMEGGAGVEERAGGGGGGGNVENELTAVERLKSENERLRSDKSVQATVLQEMRRKCKPHSTVYVRSYHHRCVLILLQCHRNCGANASR
jgi:hypothetical protein